MMYSKDWNLPRIDHRITLTMLLFLLIAITVLQRLRGADASQPESFKDTTIEASATNTAATDPGTADHETLNADMAAVARASPSFLTYLRTLDGGSLAGKSRTHPQYRQPEFYLSHREVENNVSKE